MKRALVTGAAGFIGSHLTEELIDRGYEVRALDSLATGSLNNLESIADHNSFTFIDGDIRDKETLDSCIEGVDYVFHQAAVASVQRSFEQPSVVSDINCTGTSMLLEAAKKADVETVVVASSAAVYGSGGELPKREAMPVAPESPYALSKQYTEQAAVQIGAEYDFNAVGLRYFNVFGPWQDPEGEYAAVIPKFISLMVSGDRPTVFGDGEQSRDFVFVDDVVAANIQAAESGVTGEVFNIARGERTTINELVDQLNEILGADIEPRYEAPRPGDIRHSVAEISKARNQLDYEASTPFEDGLRQTVTQFQ
jgi:nucleoside-diphosphate-sugar epimerase